MELLKKYLMNNYDLERSNKTIEFLKERIGHEKLERADDLNRGVTR